MTDHFEKLAGGKVPEASPSEMKAARHFLDETSAQSPKTAVVSDIEGAAATVELEKLRSKYAELKQIMHQAIEHLEASDASIKDCWRLLLRILISTSQQQSENPGESRKPFDRTRPLAVRDDGLLSNFPIRVEDKVIELPPSKSTLVRVIDPSNGKNRALILGIDIRGLEAQFAPFPNVARDKILLAAGKVLMEHLGLLGEAMHDLSENVDADLALLL